jgi:protein-S-isoprenylcysteine O-methyltransferase Ste14
VRSAPALLAWLWIAFVLCWLLLAQFNKKTSRQSPWLRGLWARLAVILGVLLFMLIRHHALAARITWIGRPLPLHAGVAAQWLGVGLCVIGFAFAFWARAHIGRNWGMPMSLRQGHALVTSGPYAYVRHPIYTGLMIAMIGSALTLGAISLAIFALCFAYFVVSARTEEKMMLAQFPDAYPAYRRRTRMLIPFIL